ncbi:aldo-keto reductase family 4 member C11 [Cryptomeria japonica]|uniref:aldo-keto reductase family 4 member C11 n=1 Tax=Cryptomeria japonica TaxID=3369 RepID=UPI0025AD87F6|nr:aldo-keto reductase family 4 member C11 [Cryptomeria japonica]
MLAEYSEEIMEVFKKTAQLNTGAKIPLIGLGTTAVDQNEEVIKAAVTTALQVGYRHFDTASSYNSERPLGEALHMAFHNGLVNREDVFVTTKLWSNQHDDPVTAIKNSLKNLQIDYVDLYLIHLPVRFRKEVPMSAFLDRKPTELGTDVNPYYGPQEDYFLPLDMKSTWNGMEQCLEMGLTKAIGVSNFSSKKIEDLLSHAKIPPAVDQVEMHPQWQQKKLRDYCSKHNIHVSAWSPMGAPNTSWGSNLVMDDPLVHEISQKYGKTRAQVMLRWGVEQGVSVLPKSYNKDRIFSNFQIFDWSLTPEGHDKIGMLKQAKLFRGDAFVNSTTGPYETVEELWDGEI